MRCYVLQAGRDAIVDANKVSVKVVVCEGISGLGKSRMARVAMKQAITRRQTTGSKDESWSTMFSDVNTSINIRVECRNFIATTPASIECDCALEILYEWKKYSIKQSIKNNKSSVEIKNDFITAFKKSVGTLTLPAVLTMLYNTKYKKKILPKFR